jgi:hypothetical protein
MAMIPLPALVRLPVPPSEPEKLVLELSPPTVSWPAPSDKGATGAQQAG